MADAKHRYQAYLLRLWTETSGGQAMWRVSLEEPHTGLRRGFAGLEQFVVFLTEATGARDSAGLQRLFRRRNNQITSQGSEQSQQHQIVLNRFVAACQADPRVVAATLY